MVKQVNKFILGGHSHSLVISAWIPHGKGERKIQISIPLETLDKLHAIRQHTGSLGHALWHLDRPDFQFPCSQCKADYLQEPGEVSP